MRKEVFCFGTSEEMSTPLHFTKFCLFLHTKHRTHLYYLFYSKLFYISSDEEIVEDFMIKRNGSVTLDGESLRRSFRRSLCKQESKLSRQVSSAPSETISWTEEDEVSLTELVSVYEVTVKFFYSVSSKDRPVQELIINRNIAEKQNANPFKR